MKNAINYKLLLFYIFIFIFSISLYGCGKDKIELNQISIVIGIGIDKIPGDNPFLITLEIIEPSSSTSEANVYEKTTKSTTKTSAGKSIFDAIQNLSKNNSAILDFSHAKTIIFSENLCESGLTQIMDYLNRNRQIRSTNWILISNKTSREILEHKISGEDTTSGGISNMMARLKKEPLILPVTLNNFIIGSESESRISFAPVIELQNSTNNNSEKITVEKTAIFKNNHLIGMLTDEESKNLLWLTDHSKGHNVIFITKSAKNNESITLDVFKKSSKIIPHIDGNKINMEIQCMGYASIKEVHDISMSPEILGKIEHDTETILKSQLDELITKSQKYINADFVNFSTKIYNNYPKKWIEVKEDWDTIFPNVKYTINLKIHINNIGIIKDSVISNNQAH